MANFRRRVVNEVWLKYDFCSQATELSWRRPQLQKVRSVRNATAEKMTSSDSKPFSPAPARWVPSRNTQHAAV